MRCWLGSLILTMTFAGAAAAQDTAAAPTLAHLTLDDALRLAQANSPTYRQTLTTVTPTRWAVRNAYGNLLPHVQVSSGFGYTGAGDANFGGGFTRSTSSLVSSDYNLSIGWDLNGRVLTGPAQEKARARANAADVGGAGITLRTEVSTQYFSALQAAAQTDVARQQVQRNEEFLKLATARHQVGQATLLEVRQAEVTKQNSDVALLRAEQADMTAKLELLRRIGIEPPVELDRIVLTDSFPVEEPHFQLAELLKMAGTANPALRSLEARRDGAGWDVRAAKADFLPSLSVQAGWSGFTQQYTNERLLLDQQLGTAQGQAAQCEFDNQLRTAMGVGGGIPDCFGAAGLSADGTTLLDPIRRQIHDQNSVFPFRYTGQPFRMNVSLSLPIFTGFGRSLRLAQARAQEQDADESLRARRLEVRTDVHSRYLEMHAAYRAIGMEAVARDAAREQLQLAQDHYRVGTGTSLEVADAQIAVQRAEGDYVNAVYDYHKAVVALEAAVGQPLR